MGKIKSFKQEFSLDERRKESQSILVKYPDRVPVIIEKYSRTDLPELDKKKYLVPRDMSVGQFIHILSSRLSLMPGKALFIFVKNTLPQTGKCALHYREFVSYDYVFFGETVICFECVFVILLSTASLMTNIYQTYKDEDGFLYMCYSSEKTFG